MRTPGATKQNGRRGAAAVEAAVAMFPICLFIFAVIEYARYQSVRHSLNNAAHQGCRSAVVGKRSLTTSDVQELVRTRLEGHRLKNVEIAVYAASAAGEAAEDWHACRFGDRVGVRITTTYEALFPSFGMLPTSAQLTCRASMINEVD